MCRLASFPPGFHRKEAIEILKDFEGRNVDGIGYCFIENGKFNIRKWPTSLSKVLGRNKTFLSHMDGTQKSWTIVHLRAGTHGQNSYENTHPFLVGGWAICHNGVWSDHKIARLAMGKTIKYQGETDSEVAANLINLVGPKKFSEEIDFGGVYLALNIDGSLWAIKTSGQLSMMKTDNDSIILASDFPRGYDSEEVNRGWFNFDKDGRYVKHELKNSISNLGSHHANKFYKKYPGYDSKTFSHISGVEERSHWYY